MEPRQDPPSGADAGPEAGRALGSDGVPIHYWTSGTGPPVLLVHGGLVSSKSWQGLVARLRGSHRVVAFDLRGFGLSGRAPDPAGYSIAQSGADAAAVLLAAQLAPADVVGFSIGGMVALALAGAQPELVRSLVLVSTTARLSPDQGAIFRARADRAESSGLDDEVNVHVWRAFAPAFVAAHPAFVAAYARRVAGNDPGAFVATMRALVETDLRDALPRLSVPTLVVAGAQDAGMPAKVHAAALHAAIAGSRLEVMPGVGHSVHLEDPDGFARLILGFLSATISGADA
jgi:pimeloyl-ACP methyl ester carboxylesterase